MFKKLISLLVVVLGCAAVKAQTTNISLVTSNSFRNLAPINIRNWGATNSGLSNDAALAAAAAARSEILIPQGTYDVTTNWTVLATNDLNFEFGGKLKPASGVTITIRGGVKAGDKQQIFDISAGGRILFDYSLSSSQSKNAKIWAGWWGPDDNNGGTTGDDTKLQAWLSSTTTGQAVEKSIGPGFYTVSTGLLLSNKFVIKGYGMPTLSGYLPANGYVLKVADAADDVNIEGLVLNGLTGNGTNTYGINIGSDCDRLIVKNLRFTGKLYGGGIYNTGNALYPTFYDCFASGLDNSSANGGNNLLASVFCRSTNVFVQARFMNCKVINCNGGLVIHGGANTNAGVTWQGGGFEGVGNVTLATNTISIYGAGNFSLSETHFENITNINLLRVDQSKSINLARNLMSGDYGGSVKATNLITVNGVGVLNCYGGQFSHPLSYFVNNLGSSLPVHIWGGYFDDGGYTNISDAAIAAKMNGNVLWNWDTNSVSSGTYTPTITPGSNIDAVTAYSCQYSQVGNIITVSGSVDIDATLAASTTSNINISLPVSSNLINFNELSGTAISIGSTVSQPASVLGSPATDTAALVFYSLSTVNQSFTFIFSYRVQ